MTWLIPRATYDFDRYPRLIEVVSRLTDSQIEAIKASPPKIVIPAKAGIQDGRWFPSEKTKMDSRSSLE